MQCEALCFETNYHTRWYWLEAHCIIRIHSASSAFCCLYNELVQGPNPWEQYNHSLMSYIRTSAESGGIWRVPDEATGPTCYPECSHNQHLDLMAIKHNLCDRYLRLYEVWPIQLIFIRKLVPKQGPQCPIASFIFCSSSSTSTLRYTALYM